MTSFMEFMFPLFFVLFLFNRGFSTPLICLHLPSSVYLVLWLGLSFLVHICRVSRYHEILMFGSKDMPNNTVMRQSSIVLNVWSLTNTGSTIELSSVTAMFGVFLRQTLNSHDTWAPFKSIYNSTGRHSGVLFAQW